MSEKIRRVQYFYTTVRDRPGEGYHVLSQLAREGVQLLAFNSTPIGPAFAQMTLFPEDPERFIEAAGRHGVTLQGPHHALLVQGDDEPGVLADIHGKLSDSHVNVYASSGVADGRGGYGCVLYVRPDDFERAAGVLGV